jgi:uncharacterized HAD superfamily protein
MKQKIYCIDMDGTLTKEICFTEKECDKATPVQKMIDKVAEIYRGNWVIIYTARVDELIPATIKWLRKHNVRYHAISNQKIPADLYVDDKAIFVKDFLNDYKIHSR